jgi:hypothetical protein
MNEYHGHHARPLLALPGAPLYVERRIYFRSPLLGW